MSKSSLHVSLLPFPHGLEMAQQVTCLTFRAEPTLVQGVTLARGTLCVQGYQHECGEKTLVATSSCAEKRTIPGQFEAPV